MRISPRVWLPRSTERWLDSADGGAVEGPSRAGKKNPRESGPQCVPRKNLKMRATDRQGVKGLTEREDRPRRDMPLEEHRSLTCSAGEWNGERMVYQSELDAGGPPIALVAPYRSQSGFYLIRMPSDRSPEGELRHHGVFTLIRGPALQIVMARSLHFPPPRASEAGAPKTLILVRGVRGNCAPCYEVCRRQQLHHENPVFA